MKVLAACMLVVLAACLADAARSNCELPAQPGFCKPTLYQFNYQGTNCKITAKEEGECNLAIPQGNCNPGSFYAHYRYHDGICFMFTYH